MQTLNELIKKCHVANEKIPKKYADFFPSIAYKKAFYCINPKQRGAEVQIGLHRICKTSSCKLDENTHWKPNIWNNRTNTTVKEESFVNLKGISKLDNIEQSVFDVVGLVLLSRAWVLAYGERRGKVKPLRLGSIQGECLQQGACLGVPVLAFCTIVIKSGERLLTLAIKNSMKYGRVGRRR